MTQVGEAWMPSLCSRLNARRSLRAPAAPSASGRNFGTRKSEMPRLPGGASGVRASTMWTMFGREVVVAIGDEDLLPGDAVVLAPALVAGTARVRSAPRSEPACGSVRFIVPVHSPADELAEIEPLLLRRAVRLPAARPRRGSAAGRARSPCRPRSTSPPTGVASASGRPWPPCSGSKASPFQPPST